MCQRITHGKQTALAEPEQKQLLRIDRVSGQDFAYEVIDRFEGSGHLRGVGHADHTDAIPLVGAGSECEWGARADPEQSIWEMGSQSDQVVFVAAASMQGEDRWITRRWFRSLRGGWKFNEMN